MRSSKSPQPVSITEEQATKLETRIKQRQMTDEDIELVMGLIAFSRWLQAKLARAKLTIKHLKKLFGFKSESSSASKNNNPANNADAEDITNGNTTDLQASSQVKGNSLGDNKENWDPKANHGRKSAAEYTGCQLIHINFEDEYLKKGRCPECVKSNTDAKVTPLKAKILIFLESSPLITGTRYALAKSRCVVCLTYFTAPLPKELEGNPKYAASCVASISIQHYYAGLPFYRLDNLQQLSGVPLPDSTQYDLVQEYYEYAVEPVVSVMRTLAANGNKFGYDDTNLKILEVIKQNKQAESNKDKKSVHATVLVSDYKDKRIYLFDTNTLTAGKQFSGTLDARYSNEEFISMSDASSQNFPNLDDTLMAKWIIALCLTHARRKFMDLLSDGDKDIELVIGIISDVYANDKHCKNSKLNDDDRLAYHKEHSAPKMEALRIWLNNLMLFKKVEPNSPLGEAIAYLLKRWKWLTQFLKVPGALIDNNDVERTIKILILYRKNSLFYRTCYGASIGDAMMSLIHTAAQNDVNIFHYLTALSENAAIIQDNPEQWLPWNYHCTNVASINTAPTQIDSG